MSPWTETKDWEWREMKQFGENADSSLPFVIEYKWGPWTFSVWFHCGNVITLLPTKNSRRKIHQHQPPTSGVLERSPPLPRMAVSQGKGKETVFKHLARWLTQENPVLQNIIIINKSISGTIGSKDGAKGLTLEQGPQRLNRQSCHSLPPPHLQQSRERCFPRGQLNTPSARPSAGRGWHPDLRPPPGELWNRCQEEWIMRRQSHCVQSRKRDRWQTLLHTPEINWEKNNAHK